jgi:hypothetical protein
MLGVTKVVDISELLFNMDLVQKIVDETNHYTQKLKNSRDNIFSKWTRVNDWQPMTLEEIYTVLALFMLMPTVQNPSLRPYFSCNQLVATPIFGCHFLEQI